MNGIRRWCGLLVAALLVAGCSASQDVGVAQAEVEHFRQLMTEQQFGRIYSEGSDELEKATTEQAMVSLLSAVHRKLGAVKNSKENGWNVNYKPTGSSVTLRFKTQFEKGAGDETFVYRLSGKKALLAGYHINSNNLITN